MYPENPTTQQQIEMNIPAQNEMERQLGASLMRKSSEKSWIDKLMAKDDATKISQLMRKDNLTRADIHELLGFLTTGVAKLSNYGGYERYVVLKYFVWIREYLTESELLFDYLEKVDNGTIKIQDIDYAILLNIKKRMQAVAKFGAQVYLNISNSTLSLGGYMVELLGKEHYDYVYHDPSEVKMAEQNKGLFSGLLKRG